MKKTILIILTSVVFSSGAFAGANKCLINTSKLDGASVSNSQGENLGHIARVLVDSGSGRIRYAVLEVDKAWNWNDPQVAVPFTAYQIQKQDDGALKVTLDSTQKKLEAAPRFKEGDADKLYTQNASAPVYSYWGVTWNPENRGAMNQ